MEKLFIDTFDGYVIPATLNEPKSNTLNTVVLLHGIFSTKEESGRFLRQEEMLISHNFRVIRYDHRGHGENPIASEDMRICDTVTDFIAVINKVNNTYKGNTYVVASSYGAAILLLAYQLSEIPKLDKVVLLNPVVDFISTFVCPLGEQLKGVFNKKNIATLYEDGSFMAINNIKISLSFFNEFQLLSPYLSLEKFNIPLRVIHGSSDTAVSYEVCKEYCSILDNIDFVTIHGANHAFTEPKYEKDSFNHIIQFLEKAKD